MGTSGDYDPPVSGGGDRVLAWNADDTGVYARDTSGNNRSLLVVSGNNVARVAGHTGSGLQQTAVDITVGPDPVPLQTPQLTVALWLRINAAFSGWVTEFYRSLLQAAPNDTGLFGILCLPAPRWRAKNPSNVPIDITFPDDIGNWHHITAVYDGASLFLYRDAVLVNAGGTAISGGLWAGADVFRVFDQAGTAATIDDLQIFKTALSQAEIVALMASPA